MCCIRLQKQRAGGDALSSGDFVLDRDEFASKFNKNTKLLFLNTPNNPLGKVYTRDELQMIADLCQKWDVIVIADEVYEWLVYKPYQHIKIG
jgi:kynurenine--oxoglutarate transaminase/cysteine-S-conjugate beta-lyase/glutamine--phenylpyruvate transaminase